jgi:predicted transcriptional regulator
MRVGAINLEPWRARSLLASGLLEMDEGGWYSTTRKGAKFVSEYRELVKTLQNM